MVAPGESEEIVMFDVELTSLNPFPTHQLSASVTLAIEVEFDRFFSEIETETFPPSEMTPVSMTLVASSCGGSSRTLALSLETLWPAGMDVL